MGHAWIVGGAIAYTITIAGAQGRLGRELVAQSLQRGWVVRGVVRRPDDPVLHPTRFGWLTAADSDVPLTSVNLTLTTDTRCPDDTRALVLCMSGEPFSTRATVSVQDEVVRRLCQTCPDDALICLVSAHGAGDSLARSNAGIRFMHTVYLKETYASKEAQEKMVRDRNVTCLIVRPRVLSFSPIPFNSACVPRSELAARIIAWCNSKDSDDACEGTDCGTSQGVCEGTDCGVSPGAYEGPREASGHESP